VSNEVSREAAAENSLALQRRFASVKRKCVPQGRRKKLRYAIAAVKARLRGEISVTGHPENSATNTSSSTAAINKNGQPDQRHGDDPQNDVLVAAIFFVSHRGLKHT
jgi:hypothetical protein